MFFAIAPFRMQLVVNMCYIITMCMHMFTIVLGGIC